MAQGEARSRNMATWWQHEAMERDKDREVEKLKLEMQEREIKRRYEIEMMRLSCQFGSGGQMLAVQNQQADIPVCNMPNPANFYEYQQQAHSLSISSLIEKLFGIVKFIKL